MAWEKFTGKYKRFKSMEKKQNEKAPEWKKANPNTCTHTGYYVPNGMKVFKIGKAEDLYEIILAKTCIRCGKDFVTKQSMLSINFVETIKTPKIPIQPAPEIERQPLEETPIAKVITTARPYMPQKKKGPGRPRVFYKIVKKKKVIPHYP